VAEKETWEGWTRKLWCSQERTGLAGRVQSFGGVELGSWSLLSNFQYKRPFCKYCGQSIDSVGYLIEGLG
jgi:hypothetical protein